MSEVLRFEPLERLWSRFRIDCSESDVAAFFALLYIGEFMTKLVAITLTAGASERDRTRYSLEHRLVRADGLGEWASTIDEVLVGPSHDNIRQELRPYQRQLTERFSAGDWRENALLSLQRAVAAATNVADAPVSQKQLRQWFHLLAYLRNKTRGHGAILPGQCTAALPHLRQSMLEMTENLSLFKLDWAFVRRNLSGKHRVIPIGGDATPYDPLRTQVSQSQIEDGIYVHIGNPIAVRLLNTDVDLTDFYIPNGGLKGSRYETISLITNSRKDGDASPYVSPPDQLPKSETEGREQLEVVGNAHTNLPPAMHEYIPRPDLEKDVRALLCESRHVVITLQGPGGAGKTSLALAVTEQILRSSKTFDVCVWFSARDVDLTDRGPRAVRPASTSIDDFALEYVRLTGSAGSAKKSEAREAFSAALSSTAIGPTLFAFDNFETVDDPASLYKWIDERIRPPNKILITTRVRDFSGDKPVSVSGLEQEEAIELVEKTASRLGIRSLLDAEKIAQLLDESARHPYAIKILLGEIASAGKWTKPERIIANQDKLLDALFERTFSRLSPGAQFILTVLSGWRSVVPQVALEIAVLMHSDDRLNLAEIVDELERLSMVDVIRDDRDQAFLSLPLTTAAFGKRKLVTSSHRLLAEACLETVRLFGATRRDGVARGVSQSLTRFFSEVESRLKSGRLAFSQIRPALEFAASESAVLWLRLEELLQSSEPTKETLKERELCLRRFLESEPQAEYAADAWQRLGTVLRDQGDNEGEVLAYSQIAVLSGASERAVSEAANKLNTAIARMRTGSTQSSLSVATKKEALRRIVDRLERVIPILDATDMSRLAWSHLSLGNEPRARECLGIGLQKSPENEYCLRLLQRLGS